jgi:uracil phosphoribosyltransferase
LQGGQRTEGAVGPRLRLRDERTGPKDFRELLIEISMLIGYRATRDLPLQKVQVRTPVGIAEGALLPEPQPVIVPVLRAGLGMAEGLLRIMPGAAVGHVGIHRDPQTHRPVEYYRKLPGDLGRRHVIVVDPMLATGGSAVAAIDDPSVSLAALRAAAAATKLNANRRTQPLKQAARVASSQIERRMISEVMAATGGNRKRAADELGISYKALLYKLKQAGIDGAPAWHRNGVGR